MHNIHILGATNPTVQYFISKNNKKEKIYLYSSKEKNILDLKSYNYNQFKNIFNDKDIVISLIPIDRLSYYLGEIREKNKFPNLIIACSSTSIYSKVLEKSPDRFLYQKFLNGEHSLMNYFLNISKNINCELIILRLSLLWGGKKDKNINFIFEMFNKFRIFPVLKNNCFGKRFPLHHSYLAETLLRIIENKIATGIYSLQGPEQISYFDMINTIKCKVNKKTFLVQLPLFILNLSLRISSFLKIKKLISILMMIKRQANDLDFRDYNHLPKRVLPKENEYYKFKKLINYLY
tara:strand:+ start:53 stop:928 length:876 start_codon:yes stop_codon:yes gene_type:complete